MSARLASGTWVSALLRRASAAGEFGAVLRKGDQTAGAIIVVARGRDGSCTAFARIAGLDHERWEQAAQDSVEDRQAVDSYVARQARYDEDLWVVELVTENIERLIDETIIRR